MNLILVLASAIFMRGGRYFKHGKIRLAFFISPKHGFMSYVLKNVNYPVGDASLFSEILELIAA